MGATTVYTGDLLVFLAYMTIPVVAMVFFRWHVWRRKRSYLAPVARVPLSVVKTTEVERSCLRCVHFDPETGQRELGMFPGMRELMVEGSPRMVTGTKTSAQWADFGACTKRLIITPPDEALQCDQFEEKRS